MSWLEQLLAWINRVIVFGLGLLWGFDPHDWIAWVQLTGAVLGILWIAFQFNRLRARTEKEFEAWVRHHLQQKRKQLEAERKAFLTLIHDHAAAGIWWRSSSAVLARTKLIVLFLFRVLLLRRRRPSIRHAMTLYRAGRIDDAREELEDIAADFAENFPNYDELVETKRYETCSAFLYAGSVAVEKQHARKSFDRVLELSKDTDVDARKLIARQYLESGNRDAALKQYARIISHGEKVEDKAMQAEGCRLQAKVHLLEKRSGRALRTLQKGLGLERARTTAYRGIAETQEMLGDLFVQSERTKKAAEDAYVESRDNYTFDGDTASADRVQKQLNTLRGEETRMSRALEWTGLRVERLAQFTLTLAKQMRVPPQKS